MVTEFAGNVKPNGKILDIGSGTGYPLASYLAEKDYNVTGIDSSEKMIELALSRGIKNAKFLTIDFFDFRTDEKFDGILAWDSFFHFPKDKQNVIYARVAELLHPGGYLLFTHGNQEGEISDEMMGEQFYYSCLSKEKVLQLLKESGFEVQFVYEEFKERYADRALVVLAKKSI